jgi:hypothetical protein
MPNDSGLTDWQVHAMGLTRFVRRYEATHPLHGTQNAALIYASVEGRLNERRLTKLPDIERRPLAALYGALGVWAAGAVELCRIPSPGGSGIRAFAFLMRASSEEAFGRALDARGKTPHRGAAGRGSMAAAVRTSRAVAAAGRKSPPACVFEENEKRWPKAVSELDDATARLAECASRVPGLVAGVIAQWMEEAFGEMGLWLDGLGPLDPDGVPLCERYAPVTARRRSWGGPLPGRTRAGGRASSLPSAGQAKACPLRAQRPLGGASR